MKKINRADIAYYHFFNGYNCSQSVLASYKDEFGIPEKELLKITCGFGAGMARLQETCGAVTGAYMAIGLKYGQSDKDDNESRERCYKLVNDFFSEFTKRHKSMRCSELLGCSLTSPEGKQFFNENNLKEKVCSRMVTDAVNILDEII
jgi:C_GCAxxG_C_C family probable redox protein